MRLWLLVGAVMVCIPVFGQKDPQWHTDYIPPEDTTAENRFPIWAVWSGIRQRRDTLPTGQSASRRRTYRVNW